MAPTFTCLASPDALAAWLAARLDRIPRTLGRTATVVVPAHGLAHQLRRDAVLAGDPGRVLGVRFRRLDDVARDVLARAGRDVDGGGDAFRLATLRAVLASGRAATLGLRYLEPAALAAGPGWADAIAATIDDLESAGLSCEDLARLADGGGDRLHDLAVLWRTADADRPATTRSSAALRSEAAAAAGADAAVVRPLGTVLVVLGLRPTTAELRLVAALRPAAVALLLGRPERDPAVRRAERVRAVLGATPEPDAPPPAAGRREIDLVRAYLFAEPGVLARPDRPRSAGPDGTVALEHHPGVPQEIDAAVGWVLEEVIERRTPLEDVALIVPARDPLAGLVAAALERADKGPEGAARGIPAYVAGGLPVTASPSGAVLLQLLLALRDGLEGERTIALLPHLRLTDDARHLSEAAASDLVWRSGVVGGTPGNRARGREWPAKLRARRDALRALLARMPDTDGRPDDDPDKARWAIERADAARLEADITAVLPAVEALTALAGRVLDGAPLATIWAEVRGFAARWCRLPPDPPHATALLDAAVAPVATAPLAGRDAVDHLRATLEGLRHPHGRFGEPRVFVGTAADATGLRFRAVRIVGAVEGAIPGAPREDPLLPDDVRDRVEAGGPADCLLDRAGDRVIRETHETFLAAVAADERLAISAPRRWVDDTDRELAGLVLEAAVALGRPVPETREAEPVPSLASLRRLYVGLGRDARVAADVARPAARRLALRAVAAAGGTRVPAAWLVPEDGVRSLARLRAIAAGREAAALGVDDGVLGGAAAALRLPGLAPERGISASALAMLLGCPHRFLLERVLRLRAPGARPSTREIAPREYGSLLHRVLEDFFREHGRAFCARERTLDAWTRVAWAIGEAAFEAFLGEYALADDGTVAAQKARLRRDLGDQLRAAWRDGAPAELVGVEQGFAGVPVALDGGGTLWVQGRIDRIERTADGLVIRDVKSGKSKVGEETSVALDLQIALYALVAPDVVPGAPVGSAGYVYSVRAGDAERAFAGPALRELTAAARGWLGLAAELLETRSFPHAPDDEACRYCDFAAVCGDAAATVARKLAGAPAGSLAARVAAHWGGEADGDA
ncbi:MAG TPA: PD-(D/E)XK nuclease family protein [Candidatus Binatia bacterium]|nr:PD-(D/E)XK nuclease family protein [Candidatus Binatia bacterium]